MKKLPSLSVFFPALNDGQMLPALIEKADRTARELAPVYEIIVIDDGSTDNTKDVLNGLKKKYPLLKTIHHATNRGYGGALISGFKACRHEWIFYTDGDGQYDPAELKKLVRLADEYTDVINGYKLERNDSFMRKVIGSLYNTALHFAYRIPVRDTDCDFRLIRNSAVKKIRLQSQSGMICLELLTKLHGNGCRFREVGVHHYERKHGKSQFFRPGHLARTLREHVRFYATHRHEVNAV